MNDPVTYLLSLDKLIRYFYEHFNLGNYNQAHEIAMDIVDIGQHLEDITKKLRDAKLN
jgi:hypothetical protein